jgi:trehalose-6-phosphate synthase
MERLLVISNRLPVSMARHPETGSWTYKMSSGGLVSALSGLKKKMTFTWIGWPGISARDEEEDLCYAYHCDDDEFRRGGASRGTGWSARGVDA